jgi:DNA-binding response OmpR family regulator
VAELEGLLAAARATAAHGTPTIDVAAASVAVAIEPATAEAEPAALTATQVAELAAESARAAAALAAEAAETGPPTIVIADTALDWSHHTVADHELVATDCSADAVARTAEARPMRIVLNVAAPGAFAHAAALRAHGVTAPIFGIVAQAGNERVIGLDVVEALVHPTSSDELVAAVARAAPRGARVFAAGVDADALLKMRQTLAKQGLSVSLARDTKQIDELLAMVRPQVVVIDLALPMRQGYELIMRMAATAPIPAMVLIAPDGDPGPPLVEKLRDRLAAGMGMGAKQWLAALALQKLPSKTVARHKPAGAPAR